MRKKGSQRTFSNLRRRREPLKSSVRKIAAANAWDPVDWNRRVSKGSFRSRKPLAVLVQIDHQNRVIAASPEIQQANGYYRKRFGNLAIHLGARSLGQAPRMIRLP